MEEGARRVGIVPCCSFGHGGRGAVRALRDAGGPGGGRARGLRCFSAWVPGCRRARGSVSASGRCSGGARRFPRPPSLLRGPERQMRRFARATGRGERPAGFRDRARLRARAQQWRAVRRRRRPAAPAARPGSARPGLAQLGRHPAVRTRSARSRPPAGRALRRTSRRDVNTRHPDVPSAQRRELARPRSQKGIRRKGRTLVAAARPSGASVAGVASRTLISRGVRRWSVRTPSTRRARCPPPGRRPCPGGPHPPGTPPFR